MTLTLARRATRLRAAVASFALETGTPRRLRGGATSDVYFDCRRLLLTPAGLEAACAALWGWVRLLDVTAVGGPATGADPLVAGLVLWAARRRPRVDLRGFYVLARPKAHGKGGLVHGALDRGDRAVLVDDVVTTGASLAAAAQEARRAGAVVAHALCLVDRGDGGAARLARVGVELTALSRAAEYQALARPLARRAAAR